MGDNEYLLSVVQTHFQNYLVLKQQSFYLLTKDFYLVMLGLSCSIRGSAAVV